MDEAIHRAGGPVIMACCRQLDGCPTGDAVVTEAGNLKAKMVIDMEMERIPPRKES